MRRGVVVAAVLLLPTALACGLSVTGVAVDPLANDAGGDGSASLVDARSDRDGDVRDPVDGGSDADSGDVEPGDPVACAARCKGPGRKCEPGGVCRIDGAPNEAIACPVGLPCHVVCAGNNDCKEGVDCTNASSCRIECSGKASCQNKAVTCTTGRCDVDCTGEDSCQAGVTCNASGQCRIACTGSASCANNPPTCNAANDCSIICGAQNAGVVGACVSGANCTAGNQCKVECRGKDACKNRRVEASAPDTNVVCGDGDTCEAGVLVNGRLANVDCGTGNACRGHIQCKAKSCSGRCRAAEIRLCCAPDDTSGTIVCEAPEANCQMHTGSLEQCD